MFQKWAGVRRGKESWWYPLCPDCIHHDARIICVRCMRWFCAEHFARHRLCRLVVFEPYRAKF